LSRLKPLLQFLDRSRSGAWIVRKATEPRQKPSPTL
jgi:hypothetical protein